MFGSIDWIGVLSWYCSRISYMSQGEYRMRKLTHTDNIHFILWVQTLVYVASVSEVM